MSHGYWGTDGAISIAPGRHKRAPGDDASEADVDDSGLGIMLVFKTTADVERLQGHLRKLLKNFPTAEVKS